VWHAVRFDKNPSYNNREVNFMQGLDGYASNNSSENARAPLFRHIESDFIAYKDDIKYTEFTEMLSKSQSDKNKKVFANKYSGPDEKSGPLYLFCDFIIYPCREDVKE